jgi:hypothetical protein
MMVQPAAGAQPPIPPAPSIPPDATEQDIKVVGKSVLGPGNVKFGTTSGPGLFNIGVTSIADFLQTGSPGLSRHAGQPAAGDPIGLRK